MINTLIKAIESECILRSDHEDAFLMVQEAFDRGFITKIQYEKLSDWIIGNLIHREEAIMKTMQTQNA